MSPDAKEHARGQPNQQLKYNIFFGRNQGDIMNKWLNDKYCDCCGKEINRLETYISVSDMIVCDDCYWDMDRKKFIELIGGSILVKE